MTLELLRSPSAGWVLLLGLSTAPSFSAEPFASAAPGSLYVAEGTVGVPMIYVKGTTSPSDDWLMLVTSGSVTGWHTGCMT